MKHEHAIYKFGFLKRSGKSFTEAKTYVDKCSLVKVDIHHAVILSRTIKYNYR